MLIEEFADSQFLRRCVLDPIVDVRCQLEWRDVAVSFLFVSLERDGPIPFLLAHRQNFFGRIRIECDVLEKEDESIAAQRGLLRERRQHLLQMRAKMFQRITYLDVLQKGLSVMDSTAISLCMDNKMPIVVFNMNVTGNLRRVVMGEAVGSVVSAA